MKWLLLLSACLCGCIQLPPKPVDPSKPDLPPPVVKASRADLCEMLASHIESGHIDTTDELVRVLQLMQDNGRWTAADSDAVDAVLPGLPTAKRALTKDDAAKLKSVK